MMLGIRTQETEKFNSFMELIQSKASAEDKVFFVDAGEGRTMETDQIECEDLTGWLIPQSKTEEFQPIWENDEVDDEWIEFFCWAEWSENNGLVSIEFVFE